MPRPRRKQLSPRQAGSAAANSIQCEASGNFWMVCSQGFQGCCSSNSCRVCMQIGPVEGIGKSSSATKTTKLISTSAIAVENTPSPSDSTPTSASLITSTITRPTSTTTVDLSSATKKGPTKTTNSAGVTVTITGADRTHSATTTTTATLAPVVSDSPPPQSPNLGLPIGIAVGVAALIILAALIFFLIRRRRRRRASASPSVADTPTSTSGLFPFPFGKKRTSASTGLPPYSDSDYVGSPELPGDCMYVPASELDSTVSPMSSAVSPMSPASELPTPEMNAGRWGGGIRGGQGVELPTTPVSPVELKPMPAQAQEAVEPEIGMGTLNQRNNRRTEGGRHVMSFMQYEAGTEAVENRTPEER
ncbi:hypothetical protein EDC01DRAFT_777540 [Geopyxis carbonaria]|nr:hypothetical protein EDC01DRAFT_777540 [Geopyxis carbonaria]